MAKSKTRGSDDVEYTWAWDNKLEGVDATDWPDMGAAVTYDYRGDGTRHSRTQGSDTTYYHYAAGFGVTNEENGTDVRTYIGGAHFDGTSSSLGTASYYVTDLLGSTRGLYDGSENAVGLREYTPYGMLYGDELGSGVTRGFTGHHTDPLTGNHFAAFRVLDPSMGRWLKRDPLGMIDGPNMYGYVNGNPVNGIDPNGLWTVSLQAGALVAGGGEVGYNSGQLSVRGFLGFGFGLSLGLDISDSSIESVRNDFTVDVGLTGNTNLRVILISTEVEGRVLYSYQLGPCGESELNASLVAGAGVPGTRLSLSSGVAYRQHMTPQRHTREFGPAAGLSYGFGGFLGLGVLLGSTANIR